MVDDLLPLVPVLRPARVDKWSHAVVGFLIPPTDGPHLIAPSGTISVALACLASPTPVSWKSVSLVIAKRSLFLTAAFSMAKNPDRLAGHRPSRALSVKLSYSKPILPLSSTSSDLQSISKLVLKTRRDSD